MSSIISVESHDFPDDVSEGPIKSWVATFPEGTLEFKGLTGRTELDFYPEGHELPSLSVRSTARTAFVFNPSGLIDNSTMATLLGQLTKTIDDAISASQLSIDGLPDESKSKLQDFSSILTTAEPDMKRLVEEEKAEPAHVNRRKSLRDEIVKQARKILSDTKKVKVAVEAVKAANEIQETLNKPQSDETGEIPKPTLTREQARCARIDEWLRMLGEDKTNFITFRSDDERLCLTWTIVNKTLEDDGDFEWILRQTQALALLFNEERFTKACAEVHLKGGNQ